MVARLLNYRPIQLTLSTLIILGMLVCVFTPNYFLFKMGARFAVQIMFGYLFLGFLFLIVKQPKLMFTSFACCAGLCLFLKNSTNTSLILPAKTNEATVSIAHYNMSNTNDDFEGLINEMLNSEVDILSIQEVNPDWNKVLLSKLSEKYPNHNTAWGNNFIGLSVFSKYPLVSKETFYSNGLPNLKASILAEGNGKEIHFICSYAPPAFYSSDYEKQKKHFETIAKYTKNINAPVITVGDYNAVPWSDEIQDFRESSQLNDSRRGFTPSSSFFKVPYDHIFYSDHLKCIEFKTLRNTKSNHLGIQGIYQFNSKHIDAKKSSKEF